MKVGLILVDIQNDYFKGGKYELVNPEQAAIQAGRVLALFRKKEWQIFHVRHISTKNDAGFFIPDTVGADFYKECCPLAGEEIICKHKPDSFLGTNLREKLEDTGVRELVVCGMMTHMCIDTTVRSASGLGYPVTLIEDACAARNLEWQGKIILAEQIQNAYMAALDGTFARVQKADVWIKEHQ